MIVEQFLIESLSGDKHKAEEEHVDKTKTNHKRLLLGLLNVILAGIAGYLAWNCNSGQHVALKILYTIIAAVFSGLYVLYYFVYHILIRSSCD
jgi:hypothetical protein